VKRVREEEEWECGRGEGGVANNVARFPSKSNDPRFFCVPVGPGTT
jgi:hypothetical protein